MDEKLLENKATQGAEHYFEKYRAQIESLENSRLAKTRSITTHDIAVLGKQLDQFEAFRQMCEEEGTTNLLGKLPNIALDVITLVHGTSIIPVVASIQPIDEEQGIVYFKNIRVEDARGTLDNVAITGGEVVTSPLAGSIAPSGYASNAIVNEAGANGDGAATTFQFNLAQLPRSESLRITLSDDTAVEAVDIGPSPQSATSLFVSCTKSRAISSITLKPRRLEAANIWNIPAVCFNAYIRAFTGLLSINV